MDDIVEAGRPDAPRSRRRNAAALVAAGLVAGLVVAGLNTAVAQTGPTPAVTASPEPGERRDGRDGKGPGRLRDGRDGKAEGKADKADRRAGRPGGKADGPWRGQGFGGRFRDGAPLHGEFTAPAPGGGYRTIAVQRGAATAVGATSITVRSEDGHTRTYAVDGETRVHAGPGGIASIAPGDRVFVVAVVTGGTARAIRVVDATRARPDRPRPTPTS